MLWLTGEESRRATEIEGKLFARRMSVRRAKQTRHGFRERNVTDHIMTDLHLFWVGTCGHSPSLWFCLSLQCCRILVKRSSPGTVGRSLQLDLDDLDSGPKSGYPYTRMVDTILCINWFRWCVGATHLHWEAFEWMKTVLTASEANSSLSRRRINPGEMWEEEP